MVLIQGLKLSHWGWGEWGGNATLNCKGRKRKQGEIKVVRHEFNRMGSLSCLIVNVHYSTREDQDCLFHFTGRRV
jgi:hypothetical protein